VRSYTYLPAQNGKLIKTTLNGATTAGAIKAGNSTLAVNYYPTSGYGAFGGTNYTTGSATGGLMLQMTAAATVDINRATSGMWQVTAPGPGGVTIASAPGGATQSWTSVEAGFAPNGALTFEIWSS
jgi:hypothetical protein